jgi:acyl dehydratase
VARSIHLRFAGLPSGLGAYPRVLLIRRQPITEVADPPEIHARVERVKLDPDGVAPYAEACGYTSGRDVPVTYPHVVAMPLHLKIFAAEAFPLRPLGLIHLSNRIEVHGEVRCGTAYDIDVAARNYRRTDTGMAFDMDSTLSSHGTPVWRETSVFLSRWPDGAVRAAARAPRPPKPPRDARVLGETEVTLRTAWMYARVSGDFNPIHLSDQTARLFGLRGAISHGMWSLARAIAEPPPARGRKGEHLDAQFLTPVQLPAQVAIKEWEEAGSMRRAMCDARSGRVHMVAEWSRAARAPA